MKTCRSVLAFLLALTMLFALTSCGNNSTPSSNENTASNASQFQANSSTTASASSYPSQPLTVIITGNAGGGMDTMVRTLQPYLEKLMGISLVPTNVYSGSVWLGWNQMLDADPDGYTIANVTVPSIFNFHNPKNEVDKTLDDFNFLCNIISDPNVIAVRPDDSRFTDVNDLADFVEWCKAHPDEGLICTQAAKGGDDHIMFVKLLRATGVTNLIELHEQGDTDKKATFYGGNCDVYIGNVGDTYAEYQNGECKILCVTSDKRSNFLPEVATCYEQGIDLYNVAGRGLCTQPGVPDEIKEQLLTYLKEAIANPDYQEKMKSLGLEIDYKEGDDYAAYMKAEDEAVVSMLDELGWS